MRSALKLGGARARKEVATYSKAAKVHNIHTIELIGSFVGRFMRRAFGARSLWLLLAEIIGVVLITLGISIWSVPAALIVGGLVLVSALELRGDPTPRMPTIRPPEDLLRNTAREAAIIINQERFGIGVVDQSSIDKLSIAECEKLIQLARAITGIKRTT